MGILSFILACMVMAPLQTSPAPNPPGDDDEIIITEIPSPGGERGGALVRAFFVAGDISITLASSLGVTSITVLNSLDQTVYYTSVDASLTGTVQFAAPTTPDTYTLIIQSSSYYGIGVFQIQ
ncbi:MAG: hypothetical protein IJU63_03840 [Bacteroidales bacterium]|nr:hypothetical protein [Bacteroidales bacterium]